MRTTLDLPDDLLHRAKRAALERRSTLRDLVAAALRRELALPLLRAGAPALPSITLAADAPVLRLGPDAIKALAAHDEEADDARFAG